MQHSSDEQRQANKSADLEQRLVAYYGPRLREQPLSQNSWHQLRRKLKQSARRRAHLGRHIRHYRSGVVRQPVPEYVRTAFNRVAYDAHVSYTSSVLLCTFKRRVRTPSVHASFYGKQPIRLILPVDTERSLPLSGLNVLLATGVARYQLVKNALLVYLLLAGFVTIGVCAGIFYALHNQLLVPILLIVAGGPILLFLLDRQKRHI
ncbi:MAG: hypothetical protein JO215_13990, partial [Ktedonobacteraceae bacterium]|nr:hypothetical protein [Ktedonobacteraceae bacterium]